MQQTVPTATVKSINRGEILNRPAGAYIELRDNVVRVLVERGVPTATGSGAFGLSGREVWKIVAADPISLFRCLESGDPLPVRDRRDSMRLQRALGTVRKSTPGGRSSAELFCGGYAEIVLQRLNEQTRRERLASEARISDLNTKMAYQQYLLTPEWRAKKAAALAWAGYRCQVCNQGDEELHVHHRVYSRCGANA